MKASNLSKRNRILLIVVSMLALLPLACNSPASQPTQTPQAQATATPVAKDTATPAAQVTKPAVSQPTSTAVSQPTKPAVSQPTATSLAGTPTAKPSGLAGALGQLAPLTSLSSYRSTMTMGEVVTDGAKSPLMSWTMEWTKEGPSTHMVMGEGAGGIETITIGDKTWMKMMGSWFETPASPTDTESPQLSDNPENFLPQTDVTVKQVGTETVNGIPCKKSTFTGKATINLAEAGEPANNVTWEMSGELWVADKAGLPAVPIKQTSQWKGDLFGGLLGTGAPGAGAQGTYYMVMELSDVNGPISIKPPEGVTQFPSIPGFPTGIPGIPTPAAGLTPGTEPQVSLDTCWDYVPDPSNADTADAVTQMLATTLALAAVPGQPTVMQAYVTEDALADVKAYYAEELPAWEWTQIGTGPLAPGGWDTSWKQAGFALRVLLLAPTQVDPTTKIVVVCSFAK